VSKQLPNREQATQLLLDNQCSEKVIMHCQAVANLAVQIARELSEKGFEVNVDLVEAGAMLHDLGRSKTHTVEHAIVGVQLARQLGLPQEIVNIIKRHVGAGISQEEAEWLGWPKDIYIPQSLEEKIVGYADKLLSGTRKTSIEVELQRLEEDGRSEAAERVKRLHEEITGLLGHQV
jgi:uncharacterized protein